MSDPMTNIEIEDVLSSIRRLVSEDNRPPPRLTLEMAVTPGKLVLTPALRIVADREKPAPLPLATVAAADPAFDPMSHKAAAAVLEAALSTRRDDWEPDGSEVVEEARWSLEWEAGNSMAATSPVKSHSVGLETADVMPAVEEPVIDWTGEADRAEGAAVQAAAGSDGNDESGDTLVDEDALRDIVRDILREELQGPLGERITRNVRKLVRSEINRALATHDLE